MSAKTSPRTCVFCGAGGKLSGEHLIPDWAGRLLPDHGKGTHERTRGGETITWQSSAYNRKAGIVCPDHCNSGWMSRVEQGVNGLGPPVCHRSTEPDLPTELTFPRRFPWEGGG